MIESGWFVACLVAGLAVLAWRWRRRGLRPAGGIGPLPLFDSAALGGLLVGGGLAGVTAAKCFAIYPAELLLGAALSGAVPAALATAYLLW